MLTRIELKEKIIAEINATNNVELLEQISDLIELYSNEVYEMSPEEKEAVEDGIRQIENGQWISNEEANKHIAKYLRNINER